MDNFLEILFFLFSLLIPISRSDKQDVCPTSLCGTFSLDYPFKLEHSHPNNNCNYTTLSCNEATVATPRLNLPFAGDFNVRYIDYYQPYIELYDPGQCLMSRLMNNLNLSSSPFEAIRYQNYTFYTCPRDLNSNVNFPIRCLSNVTNSTVATALVPPDSMLGYGCEVIGSWLLPVLEAEQFEFDGVEGDLYLTWNSTTCKACDDQTNTGGSKENSWRKFARSPYFVPISGAFAMVLVICLMQIIKLVASRNRTVNAQPESATTGPPRSTTGGLDESTINACTEVEVVSESERTRGNDSNSPCPICLDSYVLQDSVRSIAKCEHLFHAECIELWLSKSRTCPVCRTNIVDDDDDVELRMAMVAEVMWARIRRGVGFYNHLRQMLETGRELQITLNQDQDADARTHTDVQRIIQEMDGMVVRVENCREEIQQYQAGASSSSDVRMEIVRK